MVSLLLTPLRSMTCAGSRENASLIMIDRGLCWKYYFGFTLEFVRLAVPNVRVAVGSDVFAKWKIWPAGRN